METINLHRNDPPQWFKQADFGIFIHWGLYSVPAYAPVASEDFHTITQEKSDRYLFTNQPYAEWYKNSIMIPGSPASQYHQKHYRDMPYEKFAESFRKTAKKADVEEWADAFARAGAKYVVFVTKHHDGFVLFNSWQQNPHQRNYMLDFDFVGDLAFACRKRGLRFGVYYSSLLDWTFTSKPILTYADFFLGNNNSQGYKDYCLNHWRELIERYQPDILWSDIGYPSDDRLEQLFKEYYQTVPEGMVNDRWEQYPNILRNSAGKALFNLAARIVTKKREGSETVPKVKYFDYRTIEYTSAWHQQDVWFEMCRGMDKSFGYNKFSSEKDHLSASEIRQLIGELVPKKGRLLLNVGPDGNGRIPPYQRRVLEELGSS